MKSGRNWGRLGMKSNWKTCQLGDLITFQRGHDLPKTKMQGGKYPVVGSNGIIGYHNEYTTEAPSITIGRSGNVGKPFLFKGRSWSHNTSLYIKEYNAVDPIFIYYFLQTLDLGNYAGGSAVPTLNRNHIHTLNVYVPTDIDEQRRMGAVLSVIDDKIELNTAINENLESQAQAIFKDMIADVQEQVPFTSIIQVLGGGTPKTSNQEYWNGEIPFFTPKDTGNPYVLTTEKSITPFGLNNCNSRLYPVNTVFLTARGTVGKVSLAGVPMSMNQSCYALVGKDRLHQIIVYHYALETVKALKHKASGAVFDAIITRDFDTERVPVLSSEQINGYIAVAEPIYSEILNRTLENERLAELRDTLLPKLMNGEIDVSEIKI